MRRAEPRRSFERALFVVFGLIVVNEVVVSMAWISQAFKVSGGAGRAAIVLAVMALVGSALATCSVGRVPPPCGRRS